jgi:hypothetical protein
MKIQTIALAATILMSGCAPKPSLPSTGPLALGDSEKVMVEKMTALGAQDVTEQTRFNLTLAMTGEQRTYWWQFPDKAIVGVLLAGRREQDLEVHTIEQGDPGLGIDGITKWRSQNLKIQTAREREQ